MSLSKFFERTPFFVAVNENNPRNNIVSFDCKILRHIFGKKILVNGKEHVIAEINEKTFMVELSEFEFTEPDGTVINIINNYCQHIYPNEYFHIPDTNKICVNPLIYEEILDSYTIHLHMFYSIFLTNKNPSLKMLKALRMDIDGQKYRFELGSDNVWYFVESYDDVILPMD